MRRLLDGLLVKWQQEIMILLKKKWLLMKESWLKGTKQVCVMTKGPRRHKEIY